MEFEARIKKGGEQKSTHTVEINEKDGKFEVVVADKKEIVDASFVDPNTISMLIAGRSYVANVIQDKDKKTVYIGGREFIFDEGVEESYEISEAGPGKFEKLVKAPMPGSVVKINAKEGDVVGQGSLLIIVEAMKMENELRAPVDVVVEKIMVKEKEQVDGMQVLMELSQKEG